MRSHGRRSIAASRSPRDLMDEPMLRAGGFRAHVVTLFPEAFPGVLGLSLTGRALEEGRWALETFALRAHGIGRHRNVDDTPAGGGAGLVIRPDVMDAAITEAMAAAPADRALWPLVCLSPRGPRFDQARARAWAGGRGITLICGRFEGIDQRVLDHHRVEEVSLGDFVMTGGEIAAQAMLDATIRLREGVIGNAESLAEESHSAGLLEHPHYTRPAEWAGRRIPEVLLSGDHGRIAAWRRAEAEALTAARRPDLFAAHLAAREAAEAAAAEAKAAARAARRAARPQDGAMPPPQHPGRGGR